MAARNYGQYCGVVTALELVGERWALLIVRDLLVGPRRYSDLKTGLPRIPTNILSERLKELQNGGIVRRVALARCGLVYELTEYGQELESVVIALGRWGFKSMGEPGEGDIVTADSMTIAFRTAFRADVARSQPPCTYLIHIGDVSLIVRVAGTELHITPPIPDPPLAELELAAGPGIRRVISGELTTSQAIAQGVVHVLGGDATLLEQFAVTFHLEQLTMA